MPQSLLNALSGLAPRDAGGPVAEPQATFSTVQDSMHTTERCPATCGAGCWNGTMSCIATGHTV